MQFLRYCFILQEKAFFIRYKRLKQAKSFYEEWWCHTQTLLLFHIRVGESFLILYLLLFTFQNFSNKVLI